MQPLSARLTDRDLIQVGDLTRCFKARDAVLERPVFVKVLQPALAKDPEIRGRFEREARAVARLDHPNLVRIYESGVDPEEGLYMILEWVDGVNLSSRLAAGERYHGEKFVTVARQLLSGLAALHSVGILHRDLKPENILVRTDGIYKITDFSLAALRDAPLLTHHQAIIGTPAYMSPELAAGQPLSEASDLFALGVILFEAATGKNPFLAQSMLDTLRNVREREVHCNAQTVPELSEDCRAMLQLLLEKDPALRPGTALEAIGLLEEPKYVKDPAPKYTKRRGLLYFAAAVAVLAVWAVAMFWLGKPVPQIPETAKTPVLAEDSGRSTRQLNAGEHPEISAPKGAASDTATNQTGAQIEKVSLVNKTPADKKTTLGENKLPIVNPETPVKLQYPDSADLYLNTEPWAHVYFNGEQIGTTPLAEALRLPRGEQEIELRNSAFPPIKLHVALNDVAVRKNVELADFVALVSVKVKPWGELYLDGEHIGTTPLAKPLFVSPGKHSVRISHPEMKSLTQDFTAMPGETLSVDADLAQNKLAVQQVH